MSADNGYIIRFRNDGLYVLQMYFASNDEYPDIYAPNAITGHTVEELTRFYSDWMKDDCYLSEYGLTIDLSNEKKESTIQMDIQKFVRRSFAVKGVQVTSDNINKVAEWAAGTVLGTGTSNEHIKIDVKHALNERQTQAHVGDWVLNTKKGFKVYTDRAFKANFKAEGDGERTVVNNVYNLTVPADVTKSDYTLTTEAHEIPGVDIYRQTREQIELANSNGNG